jgi:hypothetical protein
LGGRRLRRARHLARSRARLMTTCVLKFSGIIGVEVQSIAALLQFNFLGL